MVRWGPSVLFFTCESPTLTDFKRLAITVIMVEEQPPAAISSEPPAELLETSEPGSPLEWPSRKDPDWEVFLHAMPAPGSLQAGVWIPLPLQLEFGPLLGSEALQPREQLERSAGHGQAPVPSTPYQAGNHRPRAVPDPE